MARAAARLGALEFCFALAFAALVVRAAQVQLVQGGRWSSEANVARTERVILPARRGALLDRNGVPLAVSQEYFHVGVAPNEATDPAALARLLGKQLGVSARGVERDLQGPRRWLYFYGPFTASQAQPLRGLAGVHLEREFARFYPARSLARPIVGGLGADSGRGASGVELALDPILTGRPGEAVLLKDRAGRRYDSPARVVREPVAGEDVVLTLDAELQDIAEQGLAEALDAMDAESGDIVFLDPNTGELLALASRRRGEDISLGRASVFTDPFEPGSTAKLFTAAALLKLDRVDTADAVNGEDGVWLMPISSKQTRRIEDAHATKGLLTLAQAVEVSSNIAMAKFASRLRVEEQWETLRDFGFGSPVGAEFPSESRGYLRPPQEWKPTVSRASVAMGYEFGVTPVQLAAAYGAIANDGILLAPTLVREIRNPSGEVLYRHQPEPVRRAVSPEIAARLREYLRGAVSEGGTGARAQLANYFLVGKTGTAERFEDGRYIKGQYTASFAALFPAEHPQLVVIVKIDNPKGAHSGGATAAPVTRRMLQQALAARQVALDRGRLAARSTAADTPGPARAVGPPAIEDAAPAGAPIVIPWPSSASQTAPAESRPVPNVIGSTVRSAALTLHRRGFRVDLRGAGTVTRTSPAADRSIQPGTLVTVWAQ